MTGKLLEKIQLTRILRVVSSHALLRNESFGFIPKHITALHLHQIVERVCRKSGEKRLTGAVFLEVAKAFDTVHFDAFL